MNFVLFPKHDKVIHKISIADIEISNRFDGETHLEIKINCLVILAIYLQADFIQILKLLK